MIKPYVPPEHYQGPQEEGEALDFASLSAAPQIAEPLATTTDFQTLHKTAPQAYRVAMMHNRVADHFINFSTPAFIFIASNAVMMYLLSVRYVFTAVHDGNLRIFIFFLLLGVVATNRLLAQYGFMNQSDLVIGLGATVLMYVIITSVGYGIHFTDQSHLYENAPSFEELPITSPAIRMLYNFSQLFQPRFWAFLINSAVTIFIWWMVNRLTRECCVDEDAVAGDIGILTATANRLSRAVRRQEKVLPVERHRGASAAVDEGWYDLTPRDPTEAWVPLNAPQERKIPERLSGSHPGMSVFYFSIPVLIIFTLGLGVIRHLGDRGVQIGFFYLLIYLFCALLLLALTSLRQLRAFFALRSVTMSEGLMWFWLGTALCMSLVILWTASLLPRPALPPVAYVESHEVAHGTAPADRLVLEQVELRPLLAWNDRNLGHYANQVFGVFVGIVLLYGALKLLLFQVEMSRKTGDKIHPWLMAVVRLLLWFLKKLQRLAPALFVKPAFRVQRRIAQSVHYDNPRSRPDAPPMPLDDHIAYAYEALRVLARDLGVPPPESATPYEFLENFPERLGRLKDEAGDVIRLYVISQYSTLELDDRMEDRLRRFWEAFRIVRNIYVR